MDWIPLPEKAVVFGTGSIGREIARLLQAQGLTVTGVKRNVEDSLPAFDALRDRHRWRDTLSDADWCFLALPHTDETRGMIGEDALAELPAHAVVVNVGRGETLRLSPLVNQLRTDRLGGAALDTLPAEKEPLDPSSPLWEVPRLVLTPHVASYHPGRRRNVERFCERQVQRYLCGEPLADEVDLAGLQESPEST
jgi:phosphoglycerate dehydrogenase-like enzyme